MPVDFPNIRHLRAALAVADKKGISAAAHLIHLSQPAITQAVAGLERKLDVTLFERRSEGMFPTEAGMLYLSRTRRMFDLFEQGSQEACRDGTGKGQHPNGDFHKHVTASQLRALIALWETGSFSLAARTLGISQPSVHRAGRELENLAGMELFTADRRGLKVTEAAQILCRFVLLADAELCQGLYELESLKGQDSTHIAVGSMPLSRASLLPSAIHALLQSKQLVQVQAVDGPYLELLRKLRYGELDFLIGALRDPPPTDDVIQQELFIDPLAIIARRGHPLANQKNLSIRDCMAYPWIAPPKSTPAGSYLFNLLDIGNLDQTPVRIVSSSIVMVRGLLARGDYLTIMSTHQLMLEKDIGLITPLGLPLPDSQRPIGLTYRRNWKPTATQKAFIDLIKQCAQSDGYS